MIVVLTENNGTKYPIPHCYGDEYILPRTEFILHKVKTIENKLLIWYKENIYNQGDSYSVGINRHGRWEVSHSNDFELQHGRGGKHVFSEEEFLTAIKHI